jgi:hydrogenase 3 maturation protease
MGIGNRLRGDDGAGPQVIERRDRDAAGIWIDGGTTPENFLEPIARAAVELVLIVDAVDFGGRPGECRLLDVDELEAFAISSHSGSLGVFRDYLAARAEAVVKVVGIQPGRLRMETRLSDSVEESARELAGVLSRLLAP